MGRSVVLGVVEDRTSFASTGARNMNGPTRGLAAVRTALPQLRQLELGNVKFSVEVLNCLIIVGY